MKPNLNLKGSQGYNVEQDKPLNRSLQSSLENISSMSSNGALEVNLKTCAKWTKWRVYNLSMWDTHLSLYLQLSSFGHFFFPRFHICMCEALFVFAFQLR